MTDKRAAIQLEITSLIKARQTILWIRTTEEVRAEAIVREASAEAKSEMQVWDCVDGLQVASLDGTVTRPELSDPRAMLAAIREGAASAGRIVYVMRDFHRWMDPVVIRTLRSLSHELQQQTRNAAKAIVILCPGGDGSAIPAELESEAVIIDLPLPDRAEVAEILDGVLAAIPANIAAAAIPGGDLDAVIDAAVGLSASEVANCYALSLVSPGTAATIDAAMVSSEKKRVIAKDNILQISEPEPGGLDAVAGYDEFKKWLSKRRNAMTQRARDYGLPSPKGVLLVGVPGGGKSLFAKATASAWGFPLVRCDLGGMKDKYVGGTEQNIRKALALAETISPCILWFDEIEKALAGSSGPQGDGGVSSDMLGTLLSWMQDRRGSVFVIATANDVSALPPEMLRKGRFDELFFVDLPNAQERAAILDVTLRKMGRDLGAIGDASEIAAMTDGWTGAEIAELVSASMFDAFDDDAREMTLQDLKNNAATCTPLSSTMREKIQALREWSVGRARNASTPSNASNASNAATRGSRQIDL